MKPIVKLLLEGGSLNTAQTAQVLKLSEAEVNRQLDELKQQRVLLGFRPVLNLTHAKTASLPAVQVAPPQLRELVSQIKLPEPLFQVCEAACAALVAPNITAARHKAMFTRGAVVAHDARLFNGRFFIVFPFLIFLVGVML